MPRIYADASNLPLISRLIRAEMSLKQKTVKEARMFCSEYLGINIVPARMSRILSTPHIKGEMLLAIAAYLECDPRKFDPNSPENRGR